MELSKKEIGEFLLLFNRDGYVLDFSTLKFDVFTLHSVGIALCEEYQLSKGKSLSAYINQASPESVITLLKDLFEYYEENYKGEFTPHEDSYWDEYKQSYNPEYAKQYSKCKEIAIRVFGSSIPLAQEAKKLKDSFSSEYLNAQIDLMLQMQSSNPTEAIGKAKELIESCCKTILDGIGVTWDKNWDMSKLTGETLKQLNLTPQSISSTDPIDENIKAVLGNLRGITSKLAEIRNSYGSGHGKSATFTGLEIRHAKLAVGCSITFVTFLWDTYEGRNKS